MSCRALCPSAVPSNLVTSDQYNAVLARLDSEIHARAQLEADLVAAREEVAYLQRRLAAYAAHPHPRDIRSTPPASVPTAEPFRVSASQDRLPMDDDRPTSHQFASAPAKEEPALQGRDSNPKGHDKEILSHCSDISACKSALRTPDAATSLKKSSQRKSSNNLVNMAGVTKKTTKSKKERTAKVKIPGQSRYWTPDEHKLFLEALNKYGHKDLRSISAYVGTRNMTQVRTHSQKYFMRLMREAKRQNPVGTKSANTSGDEAAPQEEGTATVATASVPPRPPTSSSATVAPQGTESSNGDEPGGKVDSGTKEVDTSDKYSVPNTCGMTLLCLVGQDTLPV